MNFTQLANGSYKTGGPGFESEWHLLKPQRCHSHCRSGTNHSFSWSPNTGYPDSHRNRNSLVRSLALLDCRSSINRPPHRDDLRIIGQCLGGGKRCHPAYRMGSIDDRRQMGSWPGSFDRSNFRRTSVHWFPADELRSVPTIAEAFARRSPNQYKQGDQASKGRT